jgi:hypothetical protein
MSPNTATFPRFLKKVFLYIVKPELKMIGGRKKLKKKLLLNLNDDAASVPIDAYNIRLSDTPKRIV